MYKKKLINTIFLIFLSCFLLSISQCIPIHPRAVRNLFLYVPILSEEFIVVSGDNVISIIDKDSGALRCNVNLGSKILSPPAYKKITRTIDVVDVNWDLFSINIDNCSFSFLMRVKNEKTAFMTYNSLGKVVFFLSDGIYSITNGNLNKVVDVVLHPLTVYILNNKLYTTWNGVMRIIDLDKLVIEKEEFLPEPFKSCVIASKNYNELIWLECSDRQVERVPPVFWAVDYIPLPASGSVVGWLELDKQLSVRKKSLSKRGRFIGYFGTKPIYIDYVDDDAILFLEDSWEIRSKKGFRVLLVFNNFLFVNENTLKVIEIDSGKVVSDLGIESISAILDENKQILYVLTKKKLLKIDISDIFNGILRVLWETQIPHLNILEYGGYYPATLGVDEKY